MSYQGKAFGSREKADVARVGKRKFFNPNWKNKAVIVRGSAYKPITNPSAQQSAIFAHMRSNNALIVQALAGTGKTATTVEVMTKYIPKGKSILYVIFAKRNAEEAEGKCNDTIDVKTVHAFGLAALRNAYKGVKLEIDQYGEKNRNIAQALLGPEDEKIELRYNFCRAIVLAKAYLCDDVSSIISVCEKHEIEFCDMNETEFAEKILAALELAARQHTRIDFDDMVWLPIKKNIQVQQYDYVCPDEAQDLSPARIELVLRALKPTGKLIAVGDKNQSCFGFTGADEAALTTIQERTNADILPLHTTYRCGKAIVELAKQLVPEYIAADTNSEGLVENCTEQDMLKDPEDGGVAPGDFVISRTNAPLVSYCLALIKQGRKANVLGKDIGKNFTYMIKRSNAVSVGEFLAWVDNWKETECMRLSERNKPSEHIVDKAECLSVLCEGRNSLADVRKHIEEMFSDEDEGNKVTLLTAHKSKGLERNRCWVLMNTYKCKGTQENNILYVSWTRAREELYIVSKN